MLPDHELSKTLIIRAGNYLRRREKTSFTMFVFVRHKDVVALRITISEYGYLMKEEQTEPSRNIQITHMTTEVQPVTSI